MKKATKAAVQEMEQKYFDLVWFARSRPQDRHIDGVMRKQEMVKFNYPEEFNELCGEHGSWAHGFNSGVLAALRFVMACEYESEKQARDEFPFLDT